MAHPDTPNAVLNYDKEVDENYRINKMGVRGQYRWEADCSPHPFDIWPSTPCTRRWRIDEHWPPQTKWFSKSVSKNPFVTPIAPCP